MKTITTQVQQTSKMSQIRDALSQAFKEREEIVTGMVTALLAKEMLFLLGEPGTAKSAVCEALCNSIGGNYFSWLLGKTTTPDELFGSVSIAALKQDRYERVTTNKLPEATVAFVDEIFKGSSAILNTLLPVINERRFFNGSKPTKIPLQVLFGASNELPQGEELAALYDRFVLKYVANPIQNDSNMSDLLLNGLNVRIPTITIQELAIEQEAASNIKLTVDVVNVVVTLRKAVRAEGIVVSDRKWIQSMRVVKACAYLNGHTQVELEDLEILQHVLWTDPGQQKTVRGLILKLTNPAGDELLKIQDGIQEALANFAKVKTDNSKNLASTDIVNREIASKRISEEASSTLAKLKTAAQLLKKLSDKNPGQNKIESSIAELKQKQTALIEAELGWA